MTYAEKTSVPVNRTQQQIKELLKFHGADTFALLEQTSCVKLAFRIDGFNYLFTMDEQEDAQENRARWRALFLVVKAKLTAVEAGISTMQDEFLANTVMADGQTVGAWATPRLEQLAAGRDVPLLGSSCP